MDLWFKVSGFGFREKGVGFWVGMRVWGFFGGMEP